MSEPHNSPCPRCSKPVEVKRCASSYSRWVGGWEVVCKGCHVAFTGADTREHALDKAQNLEAHCG